MGKLHWLFLPTLAMSLNTLFLVTGAMNNDNNPIRVTWVEKEPENKHTLKVTIHDLHGTSIDEMFKHYNDLMTDEVDKTVKNNYFINEVAGYHNDIENSKKEVLKRFVHHTIATVSSNYDYDDCGVSVKDGKISLQFCPGPVTVITTNHIGVYSCSSIKSLSVYGPVIIKASKCSEQVMSRGDCDLAKLHNFLDNDCHEVEVDTSVGKYLIVIIVLGLLNIIFLIGLARFIIGFKKIKDIYNYSVSPDGISLHNFTHFDSERGNMISKLEEDFGEAPIRNKKHLSWKKSLFIILFFRPISIDSFELLDSQVINEIIYKYTIAVGSSELIKVGSQQIRFVNSDSESRLIYLFDSYDWSAEFENKYYCLQSGCNDNLMCREDMLHFTKSETKLDQDFPNFRGKIVYHTCKNMRAYCTFSNGCFIMAFALNLGIYVQLTLKLLAILPKCKLNT